MVLPIDQQGGSAGRIQCQDDSKEPLTAVIRHYVLRSKHEEFECWLREIRELERTFEGFISSEVIKPVCHTDWDDFYLNMSNPSRARDEYLTIVRFQNYTKLKIWMESKARKKMLSRVHEFSKEESLYSYHSVEHWFPTNGNETCPKGGGPPPKWKMVIYVTLVMYSQTIWVRQVTMAAFPNLNVYWVTLINTFCVVTLVTYIWFPICSRLFAFWLFPQEKYRDKLYELIPGFLKEPKAKEALRKDSLGQLQASRMAADSRFSSIPNKSMEFPFGENDEWPTIEEEVTA
jgi:uncharacterized protein